MPPIPQRRAGAGLDIVGQLQSTPAKVDLMNLLRVAFMLRDDLKVFLEQCERGPDLSRPPPQVPNRPSDPSGSARPPQAPNMGPAPMEQVFDTDMLYHTDRHQPRTINTVVKARVTVCGSPFEAIIDTGASDTVLSHTVVRKLGLMDRMEQSDMSFLTAGGHVEVPMGVLQDLPIGLGSLSLPVDAMVTPANSYNVLVGNDFLRMAAADICLSNNTLKLRIGAEHYEEVPISSIPGARRVSMLTAFIPEPSPGTEEEEFPPPASAIEQHFIQLEHLREEGLRLQQHREATAEVMGYKDTSVKDDLNVARQADLPVMANLENWFATQEAPQEAEDAYSDLPDLVPTDDEGDDNWSHCSDLSSDAEDEEAHLANPAVPDLAQDSPGSLCPVAETIDCTVPLSEELRSLQARTEALRVRIQQEEADREAEKGTATESPLPALIADLHLAMEPSPPASSLSDDDYHSVTEPLHYVMESYNAVWDSSDMKFDSGLQASYDLRYGPFDVDACSDDHGHNAFATTYWSPSNSLTLHDWSGVKTWCHPPFAYIGSALNKASAGFKQDPDHTSALLVLPDWPDAPWWPHLTESGLYHCVGYYPRGAPIFLGPTGERMTSESGTVLAIIGKSWGTGVCIPWSPWPPTQPPTVTYVEPKAVDANELKLPKIGGNLTDPQQAQAHDLANKHADLWATGSATGRTNVVTHRVDTADAQPIKCRPARHSAAQEQAIEKYIEHMIAADVIVKSKSAWGSRIVLVPKKDGGERMCIDYRPVNAVTQKDVYPLPRTSEVLDTLGKAKYFSKLDLKAGYWQIAMEPSDRHKTAFTTRQGLFEFTVMPFGLTTAPATFQRLMDSLLGDTVTVYLDDIIVFTETWEEHLTFLDEVFTRLRAAGLKASPNKCELGMEQLLYLGHIVTREGILPDPQNVQAILDATAPTDVLQLRSFLGMCTYYDEFVKGYANYAQPLFKLTRKSSEFIWTRECQDAFEDLKLMLTNAPVLRRPDTSLQYILHTDWSHHAIGAVLAQIDAEGNPCSVAQCC